MRSAVRRALVIALAAALPACGGGGGSPPPPPSGTPTPTATAPPPAPSPTPSGGTPPSTTCTVVPGTPALTTVLVTGGLDNPVDLQASPGDRSRLYVVEQAGRIRVVRDGVLLGAPFLDIVSRVGSGGERGLLGMAFHPRSAENGRFFVNYTDRAGDTHIAEFRVTSDRDRADSASERTILSVRQPDDNHNGGGLVFGLDGMLYIGLGDGGSSGDPQGNGQNLGTHLWKMLRINIDQGNPYSAPSDNPFVSRAGALPEIWAYGLRNPWRFTFDRETGDLYIGDVGEANREEVDVGLASHRGGENYGWNIMEGTSCFQPPSGCSTAGLTMPVFDYPWGSSEGLSVVGGVAYRGCRMPGYHGLYFFSDYFSRLIRSFRLQGDRATDLRDWTATLGRGLDSVSSFGVDADGEMYILDHQRGQVYKIVPEG